MQGSITSLLESLPPHFARAVSKKVALNQDYQTVFDNPAGRRVLLDLARTTGITKPKFEREPQKIVWNEAQRHLVMSMILFSGLTEEEIINQIKIERSQKT